MKIIFAFLLVVLLAFGGYHLSFRKFRIPWGSGKFYLTGLEFLFLGLLLGPLFLNILDEKTCDALAPATALLLGWIGMLFGFQFEIAKLRRFSLVFFLAGFLESFLTLAIVFGSVFFLLPVFLHITLQMRVVISILLASTAACTAQTGLALIPVENLGENQSTVKILRYLSSIDGLVAMLALMPVFIFYRQMAGTAAYRLMIGHNIIIAVVSFAALLILYNLFLVYRREQTELALIIIGMVIFISGFALIMNFSPLLANFYMGICVVNLTGEKEKIFNTLVSIEKPVYLLLLVFLGSAWRLQSLWGILIAAGYCGLRFIGKMAGGFAVSMMGPKMKDYSPALGLGLISQGGLPLAILYDFQQGFPADIAGGIVGIVLIAVIYSDIISPVMVGRLMRKGA